jgi:hypothetical protein
VAVTKVAGKQGEQLASDRFAADDNIVCSFF